MGCAKEERTEEAGQEEGEKNSADAGREAEKERVYEAGERERGRQQESQRKRNGETETRRQRTIETLWLPISQKKKPGCQTVQVETDMCFLFLGFGHVPMSDK